MHISTHTPLLSLLFTLYTRIHLCNTHSIGFFICAQHGGRCFSTTYSHHDVPHLSLTLHPDTRLSLAMPLLFFLILSATQYYPLYDTTTPKHDHGSHASVYLTPRTCFRSPSRLHLLGALPCNLFAQPPTFLLSFTRHHMRLHAHGIH